MWRISDIEKFLKVKAIDADEERLIMERAEIEAGGAEEFPSNRLDEVILDRQLRDEFMKFMDCEPDW